MRIAQVSGHYPPNFTSGGTLVPQRIARYLAQQGHESLVFAGYLDESRTPLESWTETDEAGVQVTWLVTTPWTAWNDPCNYDNPGASRAFAAWLEEQQPEVVHFHSIQTLGVGLVEVARAFGAKVVLTMHDFWWFGSRQFLVDSTMRPCSLVHEAGTCDCDSASSIAGRFQRLRKALRCVDLVLAPSASAGRVFVANGVDPELLRVNENGLPDAQVEQFAAGPVPRTGSGPLRLLYAGGAQEMKGYEVLLKAAGAVGERSGLELHAYGVPEEARSRVPSWFHPRPAYKPAQLLEVLAEHDVLVLPSVMRESHSILTREALSAGLAVVCTDTLGPEEAVVEGRNGLVVPAGDFESLAEVLNRLADDPQAARELTGQGSASPIRRLSEQCEELVRCYRELLEPADASGAATAVVQQAQEQLLRTVLFIVGIDGAPLRYRAHLPAEALRLRGHQVVIRHYRDPQLLAEVLQADAVVLYRVPATDQVLGLIDMVRQRPEPVPVLFDVDDLIFDSSLRGQVDGLEGMSERELRLWWNGVDRYRTTLEACDGFIGSTQELCEQATRLTGLPSYRYLNGVGLLLAQASDSALRKSSGHRGRTVSIGYFSGTSTHNADWAMVEPAVLAVMRRHPETRLCLGGLLQPSQELMEELGGRVTRFPFTTWHQLPGLLVQTDICLAPLTGESVFNEAKSAIKWLEAALVETPTIASPTLPFREAIEHGRTGMLASTTAEWEEALEELVASHHRRARMGSLARREALLTLSPYTQGRVYARLLVDATTHLRLHGRRESSSWEPVTKSEPFTAGVEVDPYELSSPSLVATAASRIKRLGRRAASVAREQGIKEAGRRTARKVVSRLRRRP